MVANTSGERAWAVIDSAIIAENYRALTRLPGAGEVVAVVKADAYGHGLSMAARACTWAGAWRFAVATMSEARKLRAEHPDVEIHVLAPLLPDNAQEAVRLGLLPYVSGREFFDAFSGAAREQETIARCAVTIDTGMGREGMSIGEAREIFASAPAHVEIVGLTTHFSSADEDDESVTDNQIARFSEALERILPPASVWVSLANSPGMLRFPASVAGRTVLTRPGALLYGIEPWEGALTGTGIRPALSLHALVGLVRRMPKGTSIGYGHTHTLIRDSVVATILIGYADGLSRRLSNRGSVLIDGARCRILGRISMDQCQVDVTEIADRVEVGTVATILGTSGDLTQTAWQLAQWIGTTSHEPTTTLTARIPRVHSGV